MEFIKGPSKAPRHIQDMSTAETLVPHWGYADRVVPCTNDPGSCEYLDEVYGAHDRGMIYVGVLWLTLVAVFTIWGTVRWSSQRKPSTAATTTHDSANSAEQAKAVSTHSTATRLKRALRSSMRRHLLPEAFFPFGRASRLQVLILAILAGYLMIWSFVGIAYKTWVTPVKDMEGVYNTRTSLGPWSDRVGVLAYALTPLSVLLSTRESFLSVVTGVPYQNFNFLHRWLGYIIVVQSSLHTIGWCVIEIRLYQPQPEVAQGWITQLYMIWGLVAMILLLMLFVLSLPPVIRWTGYEFFRKSHYVLALVYIGACIGHWEQLHCFLTPSIIIWFLDRAVRAVRTWLMHNRNANRFSLGLVPVKADAGLFANPADGDVVRLDFRMRASPWKVGQHFYLCFPEGSIWQSHPMTPLSHPRQTEGLVTHSYVFRAKSGETRKMAELITKKLAAHPAESETPRTSTDLSVILTGPYGECLAEQLTPHNNVLCVAGGTGITYVLPVLLELVDRDLSNRKVELLWVVRRSRDAEWVKPELEVLRDNPRISIRIVVTREGAESGSSSEKVSEEKEVMPDKSADEKVQLSSVSVQRRPSGSGHPDLGQCVRDFVEGTAGGPSVVFGSGPVSMITDLRKAVAGLNSGERVWKGEERYDVALCYDERLER